MHLEQPFAGTFLTELFLSKKQGFPSTGSSWFSLNDRIERARLSRIAKAINEPSTTIHYNIKKLEKEGAIVTYKAVFDYAKIQEGFCAYVLINVSPSEYEHDWSKYETQIAKELAKHKEVESLDIVTGEWDMILKVRTKDQSEFYNFLERVINRVAIQKSITLVSLRQVKSDFILR